MTTMIVMAMAMRVFNLMMIMNMTRILLSLRFCI